MPSPKLPTGTLRKDQIEVIFADSIAYHLNIFREAISKYEPSSLYHAWRQLVRSTDELINIGSELRIASDVDQFRNFAFDARNKDSLNSVTALIVKNFDANVANRFAALSSMAFVLDQAYRLSGNSLMLGAYSLNSTSNSIVYFQSRRQYTTTLLGLIPQVASGTVPIEYTDVLLEIQPHVDGCLLAVTTAYFNLLLNECLPNFEIHSDGITATHAFKFSHLESFFMEPERLSLVDELEFRVAKDAIESKQLHIPSGRVFSFAEVANTMESFKSVFSKYNTEALVQYKEINGLLCDVAVYLIDDFNFEVPDHVFEQIEKKYPSLDLCLISDDYFELLCSYSPFQKIGRSFFTTVVLLNRFIYRRLTSALLKNKRFQIHSGFVFEDRVKCVLSDYGFNVQDIKRINRKEFDVVAIKDGRIFNFQCKNNYYEVATVSNNYKRVARLNNLLCRYYEKAIDKERRRENLLTDHLGITQIEHFVVSRFPVITANQHIINFNALAEWMRTRNYSRLN